MRRTAIGLIALVLLATATALWAASVSGYEAFHGACARVGAVMAVAWLAYDQIARLPTWILAAVPALLVILAIRPKWLLVAIPLVIAIAILKPRRKPKR